MHIRAFVRPGTARSLFASMAVLGLAAWVATACGTSDDGSARGGGPDGGTTTDGSDGDGAKDPWTPPPGFALVADLDRQGAPADVTSLGEAGGISYFSATDGAHGVELWRSDGTQAGTSLVKDIAPGTLDASPQKIGVIGARLVFVAASQIWSTDGTDAGTLTLANADACSLGTTLYSALFDGSLYFCGRVIPADGGTVTASLWKTDGTAAGTGVAGTQAPSAGLVAVNGVLLYSTSQSLWRYDGASDGAAIAGLTGIYGFGTLGNKVVFLGADTATGSEPWISDGTAAGTARIADIYPGAEDGATPGTPVVVGDAAYFIGRTFATSSEVWRTDGTAAGTHVLRDINAGFLSSAPDDLTAVGSKLYFTARSGNGSATPDQVWASDGTAAGTVALGPSPTVPMPPARIIYGPDAIVSDGTNVYFAAEDAAHGRELWKTDGTPGGTALVADVNPGILDSCPEVPIARSSSVTIAGKLFYKCSDDRTNLQLCGTDGTAAGTGVRVVFDTNTADAILGAVRGSEPGATPVSRLFFSARETLGAPFHMASSDGSAAGTVVTPLPLASDERRALNFVAPVVVGSLAYYFGWDAAHGVELWRSDGSAAGTAMVQDIVAGPEGSVADGYSALPRPVVVGTTLYFPARHGLWKLDTSQGPNAVAVSVADVIPGSRGSVVDPDAWHAVAGGDALYYFASTDGSVSGQGIFRTDATSTQLLASVRYPGALGVAGAKPYWFTLLGSGAELWTSDGTAASSRKVLDFSAPPVAARGIAPLGTAGDIVFVTGSGGPPWTLWKSDGSAPGTVALKTFDSLDFRSSNEPFDAGIVGHQIFFPAADGASGSELWKTDGTAAGTVLVADINPGKTPSGLPASSSPGNLVNVDGILYFTATDGTHGAELWSSDGTSANTRMRGDLMPGGAGSNPSAVVLMSGKLYFAATEYHVGRELWSYTP